MVSSKCKECGKELSDQVGACVECAALIDGGDGAQVKDGFIMRVFLFLSRLTLTLMRVFFVLLGLLIVIFFGLIYISGEWVGSDIFVAPLLIFSTYLLIWLPTTVLRKMDKKAKTSSKKILFIVSALMLPVILGFIATYINEKSTNYMLNASLPGCSANIVVNEVKKIIPYEVGLIGITNIEEESFNPQTKTRMCKAVLTTSTHGSTEIQYMVALMEGKPNYFYVKPL